MDWKKSIGRAIGRGVLRSLIWIVRLLPLEVGLALGRMLGTLMRILARKRYRTALKNLHIAFGDTMPESERVRIAKACFRHFGMFAIEGIKFAFMSQEECDRRITVVGYEQYQEIIDLKRGCLFICGHLGNFEIMGRFVQSRGQEVIALARVARDRGTTDIMIGLRERMGIKVVTLGQSMKPVFAGLKRNANIAIVCDQNAADVFVPFFGRLTGTVDGPARIALRTGAPMLFPYCVRDGRGHYHVTAEGSVYFAESTGDERADVERVMTEVNHRLEQTIRRYPEQWLWFHDRWRSTPPIAAGETDAVAREVA